MSKEDISNAVEITEIVSQEDLVAQAMIETTTIMADELDSNKCSRLVKKFIRCFKSKLIILGAMAKFLRLRGWLLIRVYSTKSVSRARIAIEL